MTIIKNLLEDINQSDRNLYQKDFLLTSEKTREELIMILQIAETLKHLRDNNISVKCFDSGLAVSLFRDNSTRTRFSFASACNMLGLEVQDLDETKSQIAHGETVRETANMISFLTDIIGIRDDMYLGEGNKYMREFADALDDGYKNNVLSSRPGVINLQCDIDHPTQSMADLLHLKKYFGSLENLKGKKIAISWAYSPSYGKPLSVPQGIISLMTRFGMDVALAYPEGYELIQEVVNKASQHAQENYGRFRTFNTMEEAFKDADIVYPKSWAPFSIMERRTHLLKNKDVDGLKNLEQECLQNNARYKNWECNEEKMKLTNQGNALYMHCLPADISGISCAEGEVSAGVFEKYRIETYKEAGYKPYIIAAMILTNCFKEPGKILKKIYKKGMQRTGM